MARQESNLDFEWSTTNGVVWLLENPLVQVVLHTPYTEGASPEAWFGEDRVVCSSFERAQNTLELMLQRRPEEVVEFYNELPRLQEQEEEE